MRTKLIVMARHQLLREGLAALLGSRSDIELLAEAADGQEGVRMTARLMPQVVLMEMQMPGLHGVDAAQRILATSSDSQIICLAAEEPSWMLRRALEAGVRGILGKNCGLEELLRAITAVTNRQLYLSPLLADAAIAACIDRPGRAAATGVFVLLTSKEREIVQLLAEGLSTKEAALHLGLSYKTVAAHREHASAKLGARGIADITRYAIREGLVVP
ncbi:response regulator transcription factor [Mitsuaria sp. 7]|uniref:response regulator transcription factor n=1 Tax=Mitsuaria sp. 7 TaxID=1658665 RepID=UPI0007DDD76A|nr:response regulator transcription factor [Mitsuaria sp. 7]ANH67701.1 hypothetical protein ABE85_09195 [Mitsuaria sp. 7]